MLRCLIVVATFVSLLWTTTSVPAELFSGDAPTREWSRFSAKDFPDPVSGMVFRETDLVCAGMPLGGLGTGCIDLETTGVLGFSSIFRPAVMVEPTPYQTLRNKQLYAPFLGFEVGGKVWVLAASKIIAGGTFRGCIDPVDPGNYTQNETYMRHWQIELPATPGVEPAESIRYFGHYPIADLDYSTNGPIQASLRAWSPFLPGNAKESGTPVAIFEVTLHNQSDSAQQGRLAFSFPGPHVNDIHSGPIKRNGDMVSAGPVSYALRPLGEAHDVQTGRELFPGTADWSRIGEGLPPPVPQNLGSSCSVAIRLAANESKSYRFALAWHVKHWLGGAYNEIKHFDETWAENEVTLAKYARNERSRYVSKYTEWFDSPQNVLEKMEREHSTLLQRVIEWQSEVYSTPDLPPWLQSALINNLALFAEDSLWAAPTGDIAGWSSPTGAFQMTECPRTCAIVGCIASNYYGDLPIAYFFPELERMILRGYVAYMRADGAVPFLYPPRDFTKASYEWQIGLNGACFADLVHRLWLRTGDDDIVREFYPAVKKNVEFTIGLADGEHGLISFHREGPGQEWWEHTPVYGMVTHLAGVRLAQLRFAQEMAAEVGDSAFEQQCEEWIENASRLLEKHLWNETTQSYDFYRYPAKDLHSDDIMSSQLDGQWMVDLHGSQAVFSVNRIQAVLNTIRKTCYVDRGLAGFADAETGPDLARYGTFPPEVNIVAMTYMYNGHPELGLEIARRNMDNIIRQQGLGWDMPNLIRCDTGARTYGADYYQNMVLWGLPAALAGQDLAGPCKKDGLVARMLRAAN